VVVNDDVDGLRPRKGFLTESFPSRGIEGDQAVALFRELRGEILNEIRPRKESVHRNHSAFDVAGRILTPFLKNVSEAQDASESISIRSNMGKQDGVLG
jgi:hypothetical protein